MIQGESIGGMRRVVDETDRAIQRCRGCRSPALERTLDLGVQPHAGSFPTEEELASNLAWPLVLDRCGACGLFQLAGASPPESDVQGAPAPTGSATIARHVERLVDAIIDGGYASPGARIVDLASHGGHLAPFLAARGIDALVIEPVPWRVADLRAAGHRVLAVDPEGSDVDLGEALEADLLIDFYRLAHLPDLAAGVRAMASMLRPGGMAIIEFDHALTTIAETQFDAIRHGHFSYLTLTALEPLLARHGLVVLHASRQPVYGGALRLVLRRGLAAVVDPTVAEIRKAEREAGLSDPGRLAGLAGRVAERCEALRTHLVALGARGGSVGGYGAPTRASTLLNAAGITAHELPYTVDRASAKHGRFLPGSGIPILAPDVLRATAPDEVLILTWDIAPEVVEQLADMASTTLFVVPLPELRFLSAPRSGDSR